MQGHLEEHINPTEVFKEDLSKQRYAEFDSKLHTATC